MTPKRRNKKEQLFWVVRHPKGFYLWTTIRLTRQSSMLQVPFVLFWKNNYREGYRCVRVRLVEVKGK